MKLADLKTVFALNCDKASELVSTALDRELTASERWGLRLHTFVCKPCRRLVRQLRAIRQLMGSIPESFQATSDDVVARLSDERRRQIKQLLTDAGSAE